MTKPLITRPGWRVKGLTFIHPFDDPDVIAGQGTVGMEMLRQHADPIHAVFAGRWRRLIAGVAAYIKDIRPEIKVIGVEPEDAPTMGVRWQQDGASPAPAVIGCVSPTVSL